MAYFRIACYNARGIMASARYIHSLLDTHDVDIIGISEHWLFPNSLHFLKSIHTKYDAFGVCSTKSDPYTSHHRGQGGIAFLYKKSLANRVTALDIDDDRICGLCFKFPDGRIYKIIMVYLPPGNYGNQEYGEYIEKLYDVYHEHINERCEGIIMGDFNCEVKGDKCQRVTPHRGNMVTKFITDTASMSVNLLGRCNGPDYTFDPFEAHTNTSMIDHILMESSRSSWVRRCEILDEDENSSDHLPILLELNVPIYKEAPKQVTTNLKWKSYSREEINEKYTCNVEEALEDIKIPEIENYRLKEIEKYYDNLVNILNKCAKDNIKQAKYTPYFKPFWNKILKELHNDMIAKRIVWLQDGRPRDDSTSHLQYKIAKKLFRKQIRNEENQWYKKEFEEMERASEIDQNMFWKIVKRKQGQKCTRTYEIKFDGESCQTSDEIAGGWARYFTQLYCFQEDNNFDEDFRGRIEDKLSEMKNNPLIIDDFLDQDVTVIEVTDAMKTLKLRKTGGDDGLTNEHLVYGGEKLGHHLSSLFTLMIQAENVPAKMKSGLTITLLKPGKKVKSDPDSYRGITLLPVIYKLFEKIMLRRMRIFLNKDGRTFPDPLQYAYQEGLSSINATFGITETISYNVERGSKVFLCLLDSRKAFDTVWHSGLFCRLYELGISGKLWKLILDAYTGMTSSVLFKGVTSDQFKILQSTRQGSIWGSLFFLIVINPLISELRKMDIGAYVGNIFSGVHVQADDIALVATSKHHLQLMMNKVYEYSCKWRFMLHPGKTKVLVFNESPRHSKHNNQVRKWNVGDSICSEVESHVHCGILLSTSSSLQRTKEACRKGRGVMMAICNMLNESKEMNPLTCLKLYHTVVLPSATYGCELWCNLTKTEKLMLERTQRFCAKKMQHFGRRTHSNICCPMLGLHSLEAFTDSVKLKFLRRVLMLPPKFTSKRILLQRVFQAQLNSKYTSGYVKDILDLCHKYSVMSILDDFLKNLSFPDKTPWKRIINSELRRTEYDKFTDATKDDPDFKRFTAVHPDPFTPSPIWRVAREKHHMVNKCYKAAKALAYTHITGSALLCEYCGRLVEDPLLHYALQCQHVHEEREIFWGIIIDTFTAETGAFLHNLEDEKFLEVMLGGPNDQFHKYEEHVAFMAIGINYLNKMFEKVNHFQDF